MNILARLQTVDNVKGYKPSKEYALKQARELRKPGAGNDSPGGERSSSGKATMDNMDLLGDQEDDLTEEEAEALALQKAKGKGKGFKGECYNCGKTGHRAADCWAKGGGKEGAQKGQKGQCQKGI